MTETVRFDSLWGFTPINPQWSCKIYADPPEPIRNVIFEFFNSFLDWLDFFIEFGPDLMDIFEYLYEFFDYVLTNCP